MTCETCKGTGIIQLFSSVVPCTCRAKAEPGGGQTEVGTLDVTGVSEFQGIYFDVLQCICNSEPFPRF